MSTTKGEKKTTLAFSFRGERLAALIAGKGLRQADIARALDVSEGVVSRWVKDPVYTPSFPNFLRLCALLGCDPNILISENQSFSELLLDSVRLTAGDDAADIMAIVLQLEPRDRTVLLGRVQVHAENISKSRDELEISAPNDTLKAPADHS